MAFYKVSSNDKNMWRADTYRFTVETKDDPSVAELKADVARRNKIAREMLRSGRTTLRTYKNPHGTALYRVRLMARGERRIPYAYIDEATGTIRMGKKIAHSNADCCLRHEFAKTFDVYVVEDTTAEWMMERELETGLTPGQLKKIDRTNHERIMREMKEDEILREQGIVPMYKDGEKVYISKDRQIDELMMRGVPQSVIDRLI